MNKDFNISILMDFYGDLLTEKQVLALDYYYNQDYSLNEIAEHMDISRQGVRDFIKRGEKQLMDFEEKLNLAKRFSRLHSLTDSIYSDVEKLELSVSDNNELINNIKNTLSQIKDNL